MLVISTMRNERFGEGGVVELVRRLSFHRLVVVHKELVPRLSEGRMVRRKSVRVGQTLVYLGHIGGRGMLSCEVSFVIILSLVFGTGHKIGLCSILLEAVL